MQCTTFTTCVHVFLQILITKLENKDEFGLGVDDIVESENIDVFEFFQERDLSNGGAGGALFCVQVDLLESNDLVCNP